MGTYIQHTLEWQNPLDFCHSFMDGTSTCVFLYSGLETAYSGRFSFFAAHPLATISANSFDALRSSLRSDSDALEHAWFGYFAYDLLHELEAIKHVPASTIALPPLWFCHFGLIYVFDHVNHSLTLHQHPSIAPPRNPQNTSPPHGISWRINRLASNMSKAEYIAHIHTIKDAIFSGRFYQANLTRKFFGEFEHIPDTYALFRELCRISPAPYSAYLQTPSGTILSSSPERFLTIARDGQMESRPIKGTARRFSDPQEDKRSKAFLASSEKDKAENLMIVDLMRNDFSRVCETGSVQVSNLFEVASFKTVHHMDSTVTGLKRRTIPTLDAIKACFPPGSMTGAPKVEAMRWCNQLENIERGVYSGALGWLGGDGSADLSVVIRTLIVQGNRFEFQVGGGIVADSDPESEWEETITKARGILQALGVTEDIMRAL